MIPQLVYNINHAHIARAYATNNMCVCLSVQSTGKSPHNRRGRRRGESTCKHTRTWPELQAATCGHYAVDAVPVRSKRIWSRLRRMATGFFQLLYAGHRERTAFPCCAIICGVKCNVYAIHSGEKLLALIVAADLGAKLDGHAVSLIHLSRTQSAVAASLTLTLPFQIAHTSKCFIHQARTIARCCAWRVYMAIFYTLRARDHLPRLCV